MRKVAWMTLLAMGCSHADAEVAHEADRPVEVPVHVELARVERQPMPTVVQLTGTLVADQEARVAADASGVVTEVRFAIGDHVAKGQVLVVLDARSSLAQAAASQAQAEAQKAQLVVADQECTRADALRDGGAMTPQQYEAVKARCASQQEATDAALASARAASTMVDRATVRAPFDGVIGEKLVEVGAFAAGSTPVATLFADGALSVRMAVPEALVAQVTDGAIVHVHPAAFPEADLRGVVHRIGGGLRDRTRDLLVEATLDPTDVAVVPGMFARVEVEGAPQDALTVPDAVFRSDDTVHRLFVVREGRAFETVVRVGVSEDGHTAVLSDLAEGDAVVLSPSADLVDGARVE